MQKEHCGRGRVPLVATLLSFVSAICMASASLAAVSAGTSVDFDQMRPFAEFLNDVSERRRRVVYTPNQQSILDGALVGFVHVGSGHLSLQRRDMVVVDRLPILAARVYDSRVTDDMDFGAGGWALGANEHFRLTAGDSGTYRDGSGARTSFRRVGNGWQPVVSTPTDIASVEHAGDALIEVHLHNGARKEFANVSGDGVYRLAKVVDRFGNSKSYIRDAAGYLLSIITSGGRSITIGRDGDRRIASIEDDQLRRVNYVYNDLGELAEAHDLGGFVWRYEYDSNGLLSEAFAPNDRLDLSALYDDAQRVTDSYAHGLNTRYVYEQAIEGRPDLVATSVTGDRPGPTLLGQNDRGITVFSDNGRGIVSTIELDAGNRPVARHTNDDVVMRYAYGRDGRLSGRTSFADEPVTDQYHYDPDGQLSKIVDQHGLPKLQVGKRRTGHIDVVEHTTRTRYLLANTGDMIDFKKDKYAYRIDRTALGQVEQITDHQDRVATLTYFSSGALASIQYPDGPTHSFTYSALGLRETGQYSDGLSADYNYAPDGSIVSYALKKEDVSIRDMRYRLDGENRLAAMFSNEEEYAFAYDDAGNPATVTWSRGELGFEYDEHNRLQAVTGNAGERWTYDYRSGEEDLRLQADQYTVVGLSGRIDRPGSHLGYAELLRNRTRRSVYGPLSFDAEAGVFKDMGHYGVAVPGYIEASSLMRSRLLGTDFAMPTVTDGNLPAQDKFAAPSNIVFIPGELWSVNCRICPPQDPLSIDPARTSALATLAKIAHDLERCGGFTFPPPGGGGPSAPGTVTVLYTMIIPLDHVRKTEAFVFDDFFGGDGRADYTPNSGTYRIQQELRINTNNSTVTNIRRSGISSEWGSPENLSTSANCFRKTCSACASYPGGQNIVHNGQCKVGSPKRTGPANNMGSISAQVLESSDTMLKVGFDGDPGNDLQFGAPGITWDHELTIEWGSGNATWTLKMKNDGFPAHQIRINGQIARQTHPVCDSATPSARTYCASKTPLSLFPPMELNFTWSGTL